MSVTTKLNDFKYKNYYTQTLDFDVTSDDFRTKSYWYFRGGDWVQIQWDDPDINRNNKGNRMDTQILKESIIHVEDSSYFTAGSRIEMDATDHRWWVKAWYKLTFRMQPKSTIFYDVTNVNGNEITIKPALMATHNSVISQPSRIYPAKT